MENPTKPTELEFLRWYYNRAREVFNEAGCDEHYWILEDFTNKVSKEFPEGYEYNE